MEDSDQPSTSKEALRSLARRKFFEMYPVTFEVFNKYFNVEEYVLKEMEKAGPEIFRINYKIRHKFYESVYKQFYSSKTIRKKMFRRGLTMKPTPKFLKEQLMRLPVEEDKSHKTPDKRILTKVETEKSATNSDCCKKLPPDKSNKELSHKITDKENSSKQSQESPALKSKISSKPKSLPATNNNKPLATESQKITNYFATLGLNKLQKPKDLEERKRKSQSNSESQIKRVKNSESSLAEVRDNIQKDQEMGIEVVALSITTISNRKTQPKETKTTKHSNQLRPEKIKQIKRETKRTQRRIYSDDLNTDDSNIDSDVEKVDLTESKDTTLKSPLPRRNRTEDFKKPNWEPTECSVVKRVSEHDANRLTSTDSDPGMALLSLSGVCPEKGYTRSDIYEWLERGLKALQQEVVDTQITVKYSNDDYLAVDRLNAIRKQPNEVRQYIKYLLKLEVQKTNGMPWKSTTIHGSSKHSVVSAFMQMTFDEFQALVNVDKLSSHSKQSTESIVANLKKQYDAIVAKENPWPKGVQVKLSTLKKYLQAKGIKEPIRLQSIPPRLLCFEDVLEHTNLKERTSLSGDKPPDSYRLLLELCKKEYLNSCKNGFWMEGLHFTSVENERDDNLTTEVGPSSPMALPSVEPSDAVSAATMPESSTNTATLNRDSSTDNALPNDCLMPVEPPADSKKSKAPHKTKSEMVPPTQRTKEIESILNEIFGAENSTQSQTTGPTTDAAKELKRILLPTLASLDAHEVSDEPQTTKECERPSDSEEIVIDDSPESASTLLNNIIQPANSASDKIGPEQLADQCPEVSGAIPPSPNLFQSSGESEIKAQSTAPVVLQAQEMVYLPCHHSTTSNKMVNIPCHHSTTFNTEENNLTIGQISDTQDPFSQIVINEAIEVPSQTQDIDAVVKQELPMLSGEFEEPDCADWQNSVQILDVPPSEPIMIDDEETAPELLEMLMHRDTTAPTANLTHLPSLSIKHYLENFAHAQQLPSNLCLTPNLTQTEEEEESMRETSPAVVENQTNDLQEPSMLEENLLSDNSNKASNCCEDDQNEPNKTVTRGVPARQACFMLQPPRIMDSKECTQTSLKSLSIRKCLEGRKSLESQPTSEEMPTSGTSIEVSYISIAPQNIPSEIDLNPSDSNKSSSQPDMRNKQQIQIQLNLSQFSDPLETNNNVTLSAESESQNTEGSAISFCVYVSQENCVSNITSPVDTEQLKATGKQGDDGPLTSVFLTLVDGFSLVSDQVSKEIKKLQSPIKVSVKNTNAVQPKTYSNDSSLLLISSEEVADEEDSGSRRSEDSDEVYLVESEDEELEDVEIEKIDEVPSSCDNETFVPQVSREAAIENNYVQDEALSEVVSAHETVSMEETKSCRYQFVNLESRKRIKSKNQLNISGEESMKKSHEIEAQEHLISDDQEALGLEPKNNDQQKSGNLQQNVPCDVASEIHDQTKLKPNTYTEDLDFVTNAAKSPSQKVTSSQESLVQEGRFSTDSPENLQSHMRNLSQKSDEAVAESTEAFQEIAPSKGLPSAGTEITPNESATTLDVNVECTNDNQEYLDEQHVNEREPNQTNVSLNSEEHINEGLANHQQIIPALIPFTMLRSGQHLTETTKLVKQNNEQGDFVEVPFLIDRKFLKFIESHTLRTSQEPTNSLIKVHFQFESEDQCSEAAHGKSPIAEHEAQLSPTINRCQFDERAIKDWFGGEAISLASTSKSVQPTVAETKITNAGALKQNPFEEHSYSVSPAKPVALPIKSKPAPRSVKIKRAKSKNLKKQLSEPDFVPQKTHPFRSLPIASIKKPQHTEEQRQQPVVTTVEAIDYLIEDASQVVGSSTASQILGTDCTYFEGSQLLRNLAIPCEADEDIQKITTTSTERPAEPKVIIPRDRITLSEGIMARKVWQANLHWKTLSKMQIEVRFVANKHTFTVTDESAKLLFNFSPTTWCDVIRVLREIDQFEYKAKSAAATQDHRVTPLHKVLRSLFDSAAQVVNIKVINDSFSPYPSCEPAKFVYKKPFQCLTKAIPANILNRMKELKENLRNNNLDK